VTSPDAAKTFLRKNTLWRLAYKRLYRVNCVSRSVYDFLCSNLQMGNYKVDVPIVYNSIPYTRVVLTHPVNILNKQNVIVYACRFIERKNVVLFANVARQILAKHSDWQVKIFGTGPLEGLIKSILSDEL